MSEDKKGSGQPDEGLVSSGISILDEAIRTLEGIPERLGRTILGTASEGGLEQEDQPGETEESSGLLRSALVQAMITGSKLVRHLQAQQEKPGFYGVVFSHVSGVAESDRQMLAGTPVNVMASQDHPDWVGRTGYIFQKPDSSGMVTVLFNEGQYGNFLAVSTDLESPPEIEVVPGEPRVVVLFEGRFVELASPAGMTLKSGQVVKLDLDSHQILDVVDLELPGEIATVKRLYGSRAEVDFKGSSKMVVAGDLAAEMELGNQVVLDATGQLVVQNLGDLDVTYRFARRPEVSWSDIGGQEEAKAVLKEAVERRYDHPEAFRRFRKDPPNGLLLLGPSGCGKTMLAEAAARSLFERFGEVALSSGFFHIKGPEILRSLVGEQEAILRHIFILADKHFAKHGFPAVILIDECEGIAKKRGTGISGDYHETLVQTLLALMNDTTAIVILVTNRADMLDPAVVRHQRVDRKAYVRRPDREDAEDIFRIHLRGKPLDEGLSVDDVAIWACGEIFSGNYGMYKLVVQEEAGSKETIFGLQHILSGAMIWGIVDEATSSAVNRQIETGQETWLTFADLKDALSRVYQGELLVDHSEDMKEFGENLTGRVLEAHKLYQGRR